MLFTKPMNVVVVVADTLRSSHLGCYGNRTIQTPNIDAFARRSARFLRTYPESLPTIVARRGLHTGRRTYPLGNYQPVKWDIVYLPGWQPLANKEDTLAENLAHAGFQTGFVTDVLPYFAPGFNFSRGFWQWEYIRGQQQDKWRSVHSVTDLQLSRYGDPQQLRKNANQKIIPPHIANTAHVRHEEDTTTAQVFQWAMDFLEDNRHAEPFYLLVDNFNPHEPWEAPAAYYEKYADPNFDGRFIIHPQYGCADDFGYTDAEIANMEAHYSGLVSLVDTWFGRLIDKLELLGLADSTAVIFASDHGTNFADNPRRSIGKPDDAMYPPVVHLPLLVRLPGGVRAAQTVDELVYNIDITATVYDITGVQGEQEIDGQSLIPLISGKSGWSSREYVTCRYDHSFLYIDNNYWVLTNIDGQPQEIFDLTVDPDCKRNIADSVSQSVFKRAWERILADAGGNLPDYRDMNFTDAIGRAAADWKSGGQ